MASPLRAKALAAKDIKSERVTVEAWGCEFEVRGLTGTQRTHIMERSQVPAKDANGEATTKTDNNLLCQALIIASTFDPSSGDRVFEDADADALYEKSAVSLDAIAKVALRLNGLATEERAAIEKNSDATATGVGASA